MRISRSMRWATAYMLSLGQGALLMQIFEDVVKPRWGWGPLLGVLPIAYSMGALLGKALAPWIARGED